MTPWLIVVPAWGERCVQTLIKAAMPSLLASLDAAKARASFLIHTDAGGRIKAAMPSDIDVEFRPVPPGRKPHQSLGAAHRDAIASAKRGQRVVLWCADLVPSIELFDAADRRIADGKRVIMMAGTRTYGDIPPIAARARTLLAWAMAHRHPITSECFWGSGHCSIPWAIYFHRGEDICLRAFHLHPAIIVSDRDIAFDGLTIDFGLASAFTREETHVITDADEAAMVEMSPLERTLKNSAEPMSIESVAAWASKNTVAVHREFFARHPITITGRGDCGEQEICDKIIARIGT